MQVISYPTGSLDFLNPPLDSSKTANSQSRVKLDILIAGAGLGGLAAAIALSLRGHRVKVFEQAPELGEVSVLQTNTRHH